MTHQEEKTRFFIIDQENLLLGQNNLIKKSYWWSWALVGIEWLTIGLMWSSLPTSIPLWYSLPWGEARLANKAWLGLLPGLGLIFSGLNLSLSRVLSRSTKDEFLQKIGAIASLVENVFLMFIMIEIILIII